MDLTNLNYQWLVYFSVSSKDFFFIIRIRPLLCREVAEGSQTCVSVTPGKPQIRMGSDQTFTFDYVFDMDSSQEIVYETAVAQLIEESFQGFNVTVLAYGQVRYSF